MRGSYMLAGILLEVLSVVATARVAAQTPAGQPQGASVGGPAGIPSGGQVAVFRLHPPGELRNNDGIGSTDLKRYAQGMLFPVATPWTTLNSQVNGPGGMYGGGGSQCSEGNFNEEWWDTYCEKRSGKNRSSSSCERRDIHQGVDIRGGTSADCRDLASGRRWDAVPIAAVYDGTITKASGYSVHLKTEEFGEFHYLHLNMDRLFVKRGDKVKAGHRLGYMSNDFGGTPTTFHLHLEHWMAIAGQGTVPVPLYCDLAQAYSRHTGKAMAFTDGSAGCGEAAATSTTSATNTTSPIGAATGGPPGGSGSRLGVQGSEETLQVSSFWRHNGARMGLSASGDRRVFSYYAPREGLVGLVKPGTVLFEGRKDGNSYSGSILTFHPKCPPVSYAVRGPIEDEGRRVVLLGDRPVRDDQCNPVRTMPDRLVFTFVEQATATSSSPTGPTGQPVAPGTGQPGTAGGGSAGASIALGGVGVTAWAPRCTRDTCVDRKPFLDAFNTFHRNRNHRNLIPAQIDALNALLNVWDTTPELVGAQRLAYILATVYHETTNLLYPTRECACRTDLGAVACSKRLWEAGKASNYYVRDRETGHSYYGRGQIQLTLRDNYDRVGKNLGLNDSLVRQPDDALALEISAQNSVLGLYHGWYRAPAGKWLGVKDFDFEDDDDWVRARDVVIAQRRHADWVAGFGKSILAMLRVIPRAEFEQLYVATQATGGTQATDSAQTTGGAPTSGGEQAAGGAQMTGGGSQAEMAATALDKLTRTAIDLDTMSRDLAMHSLDLSRKVSSLRAQIEAGAFPSAALPSSVDEEAIHSTLDSKSAGDMRTVDFREAWPAGHKESGWCAPDDGRKALDTVIELSPDDPVILRYFRD